MCPSLEYSPSSSFHQERISVIFLLGCLAAAAGAGNLAGRRGVSLPVRPSRAPPLAKSFDAGTASSSLTASVLERAAALEDAQEEARKQAREKAAAVQARR